MHMADALLSPQVGLTFGAVSAGAVAVCAHKVRTTLDDHKVPLMGVLGAFVFAAQMINFTIPGTGSSGHIGGGLLLSILLGPHAAFLTIASVLVIQAFFFADGGLLALGTNIFNLGAFPCFIGLPFFRAIAGRTPSQARIAFAAIVAAVVGLEMGAMGVVLETLLAGRSELTLGPFVALMGGIHLPIGIIEGLVTAAVGSYVFKIRPELERQALGVAGSGESTGALRPVIVTLGVAALLTGAVVAWFASSRPDGLEWSIGKVTGRQELTSAEHGLAGVLSRLQEKTALLPDYSLPKKEEPARETAAPPWPAVDHGTSLAGVAGAAMVLIAAAGLGFIFTRRRRRAAHHP